MTSLVNKLVDTYNYLIYDLADPRMEHYFLVSSPLPIATLTGLYLYFCTSFGPRYMKHREPYNLKNAVFAYNVFLVLMSSYLFYEGCWYIFSKEFSFTCEPVDYSNSPRALRIAAGAWWYYITKVIEFMDTIFFVLRKKNNQISFLHVYHHSSMACFLWLGAKYFAGGHGIVMGTLNSFVHMIMYTYYLIAGLGPEYQKYIWWKKHVTVLQLVQFVLVLIHNLITLYHGCSYPKSIIVLMSINALFFISLFGKFFYRSYIRKKSDHSMNGSVNKGKSKNGLSNGFSKIEKNIDAIKNPAENIHGNGKHKDI